MWAARLRPSFPRCFALALPLVVLWALATPVLGVADGKAHLVNAAAVVRGELDQPTISTPLGKQQQARVPGRIAALTDIGGCLIQSEDLLPDHCPPSPHASNALVDAPENFDRYPPVFYAIVGWPTLFLQGTTAYWGVTLVAALVNAAFLATALWAAMCFARRRLLGVGVLVAVTPEVLYLMGSLNDAGFEISSALATWTCLLALLATPRPPRRLVLATAIAACSFTLARPISPAFVIAAAASVMLVAGRRRVLDLLQRTAVRVAAAAVAVAGLAALAYRTAVGSPSFIQSGRPAHPVAIFQAVYDSLQVERAILDGEIGVFGTTGLPDLALIAWVLAFAVITILGAAMAPRRVVAVIVGLVVATLLLPLVVNASYYNTIGYIWQGRDGVPLALGIPLIASTMVPDRILRALPARRVVNFVLIALAAGQALTFVWVLHRYTNGLDGSWRLAHFGWQPPGGFFLLAIAFCVWTAVVATWVGWQVASRRPSGEATEAAGPGTDPPSDRPALASAP